MPTKPFQECGRISRDARPATRTTQVSEASSIERPISAYRALRSYAAIGDSRTVELKSFEVDLCTVARWDNGQIVEENLFYDLVTFMKQVGLSE
jgi:hypothetical protein